MDPYKYETSKAADQYSVPASARPMASDDSAGSTLAADQYSSPVSRDEANAGDTRAWPSPSDRPWGGTDSAAQYSSPKVERVNAADLRARP